MQLLTSNVFIVLLIVGIILIGFVLIFMAYKISKTTETTGRIHDFVTYQNRTHSGQNPNEVIQQQFSGYFLQRTVLAGIKKLVAYLGKFTPKQSIAKADQKLTIIKNPRNIRAREFFALRLILIIIGIGLAILVNIRNFGLFNNFVFGSQVNIEATLQSNPQNSNLLLLAGFLIIICCFLLPSAWLNSQVNKVKLNINREFPDALDLLSVCADAGLGFEQALQRVGEFMNNTVGAEFRRVSSEMEVGVSRADALRNMSKRLDVSEISSFVTVVIQSETLGMRIAEVLHSQAEQYRIIRQFKAKEIAYRLPAKMIIPMALLILPALLIVILGPLIPKIMELLT